MKREDLVFKNLYNIKTAFYRSKLFFLQKWLIHC